MIAILLSLPLLCPPAPPAPAPDNLPATVTVKRVVDGDTIELEGGERVRLVGVDTPETKHPRKPVERFGKEAAAFTKRHLAGEKVKLTYDQANAATKHRDRYGRLLAYVHRERDNWDHCAELLKQGYAYAYTEFPAARLEEFRKLQREAREAKRGLWGP